MLKDLERDFNLPATMQEYNLIDRTGWYRWFVTCFRVYKMRYWQNFKLKFLQTLLNRFMTMYRNHQILNLSWYNPSFYLVWIEVWNLSRTLVRNLEVFENYIRARHIYHTYEEQEVEKVHLFCNLTFWFTYVFFYNLIYLLNMNLESIQESHLLDLGFLFFTCVMAQFRFVIKQMYQYRIENNYQYFKTSELRSTLFILTQSIVLTMIVKWGVNFKYLSIFTMVAFWLTFIETLEWYYSQFLILPGSFRVMMRDYLEGLRILIRMDGGINKKISAFGVPCLNQGFFATIFSWLLIKNRRILSKKNYILGTQLAKDSFYFYYNIFTCFDDPVYLGSDYLIASFNSPLMRNENNYQRLLNIIDMHYWVLICQLPVIIFYFMYPVKIINSMLGFDKLITGSKQFEYKQGIVQQPIVKVMTRHYLFMDVIDVLNYPLMQIAENWSPGYLHWQVLIDWILEFLSLSISKLIRGQESLFLSKLINRIFNNVVFWVLLGRIYYQEVFLNKNSYRRIIRKTLFVWALSSTCYLLYLYSYYDFV